MSCPLGHPYLVKYEMSNPTATLLLCERRKGWRARTKRPLATLTARSGCGTVLVMSAIELAPLSDRLDDEDAEEIDEGSVIEAQMRNIWQLVTDACSESIEKHYPLHLRV